MTQLDEIDLARLAKAIAPLLVKEIKNQNHEFWIDAEKHYKSHLTLDKFNLVFTDDLISALKEVADSYRTGRKLVWHMFMGLVAIGAIATAFVGWWHK